jgi:hypothetical protein
MTSKMALHSSIDALSDKSDKNIKTPVKGVERLFEHLPPDAKR